MLKAARALRKLSLVPILLWACMAQFGCAHPWYLVEWSFTQKLTDREPDVTSTESYDDLRLELTAVAVDAPDRCANWSSAQATGEAATVGEVMSASCGVEMAELERALARSRYKVISWNAVRSLANRKEGMTALEAARSLGADILLHVNSLEKALALPGRDERFEKTFYESDRRGTKGAVAALPARRAQALERGLGKRDASSARGFVAVSIDATAVLVKSGESIWFYRWTHSSTPKLDQSATQLFQCNRTNLDLCFPRMVMAPMGKIGDAIGPQIGSSRESVTGPEAANAIDAVYHQLVQEVVEALVSELRGDQVN